MKTLTTAQKVEIQKKVNNCVDMLEEFISQDMSFEFHIKMPEVKFDCRGQSAGRANGKWVSFNEHLFVENYEDMLSQTVPHEVCHYAEAYAYKITSHGERWKRLMRVVGCNSNRCHSYDIRNVMDGSVIYECKCGEQVFSKRRHNQVLRGKSYSCRKCGLTFYRIDSNDKHKIIRPLKKEVFVYKCDCREVNFTKRRHNNVALRGKFYTCTLCNKKLAFNRREMR